MTKAWNKILLQASVCLCIWAGQCAWADPITIAVASNFTAPMTALLAEFNQTSAKTVQAVYGSSGKFYAQITNGAPFQAFFSADQYKPERLEALGYTVLTSRFTYAIGGLALWSAKPQYIDGNPSRLLQGGFKKLALANPKLAPYGAAALEVISGLQLTQQTQSKWVLGENIAQTYQFVATGNAELGFVALSQVYRNGVVQNGSVWIVPRELYPPIKQDAVLLKNDPVLISLMAYIQSPAALRIIESYGYTR